MGIKIRKPRLVNAKRMSEEYPESFNYWEEDISKIKVGDVVKVCNGYDRFWTVITKVDGDKLEGTVNNYLMGNLLSTKSPPYNLGDPISFKREHIYQVWDNTINK